MRKHRQQSGFTLIELMIVISIMGVIASLAAPSFRDQLARMKIKDAANSVEMALKQARTDTLIYRSPVMFSINTTTNEIITAQAINNPTGCTISSTNSANCRITKQVFNPNVRIDGFPNTSIYFTANKKVYEGSPQDTTPNSLSDNGLNLGFCYNGVSSEKVFVSVDKTTNIRTSKQQGGCS